MKIQRTIPPVAAPIDLKCLFHGLKGILSGRKYLSELGNEIREYFDVRHVFLVSSGKAALTIAFSALKSLAHCKDEVIVPAYTCFSVPSAIVRAGLKVIPCDMDSATFDFDYDRLEKIINANTLCIVSTHLFGIPADMDRIRGICRKRSLFVIDDAAQAMGGFYKGKKLGTLGDIGIFSLGRGKNVTCGSGGFIVTDSKLIARAIGIVYSSLEVPTRKESILEYLGFVALSLFIHPVLYWFPSGLSALKLGETFFYKDFPVKKMAGVNAALMTGWQRRLKYSNLFRRRNARYLAKALDIPALNNSSAYLLRLPLMTADMASRDAIYYLSKKTGTGISRMYPTPINEIGDIKDGLSEESYPQAKGISERLVTLPTHHLLTKKDRKAICDLISSVLCRDKTTACEYDGSMHETHFCVKEPKLS